MTSPSARPTSGGAAVRGPLARVIREPGKAFRVGSALLRGHWYKLWYRLRGRHVRAGRNFRVFGSLRVQGPGEVIFGDDVLVLGRVTPWTHESGARIQIGNRVMLGDTRFGCSELITIGDDCLLARCSIMDTDFHSVRADRRMADAPVRVIPVHIAQNVWIAQEAGILAGTRIGRNSVVSFGAVCVREYPADVVLSGNPAKVAMPIPMEGRDRVPSPSPVVAPPLEATLPQQRGAPAAVGALALLLLALLSCGDSRVHPATEPLNAPLEITGLERLADTKVYFGHQSVGGNILQGVGELLDHEEHRRIRVIRGDTPIAVPGPALVESYIGRNGDPQSKVDAFVAALRNGLGPGGGLALFKFCYVDVRNDTNVDSLFALYQRAVGEVRASHPEVTLVHVTLPLTEDESAIRRLARTALGKPPSRDLNAKRNAYNDRIRRTYGAEPVFDLARIQSTRADGTRSSFEQGGASVFTLAPEYTDDGAHLNRLGRITAARELLRVLATAAAARG